MPKLEEILSIVNINYVMINLKAENNGEENLANEEENVNCKLFIIFLKTFLN